MTNAEETITDTDLVCSFNRSSNLSPIPHTLEFYLYSRKLKSKLYFFWFIARAVKMYAPPIRRALFEVDITKSDWPVCFNEFKFLKHSNETYEEQETETSKAAGHDHTNTIFFSPIARLYLHKEMAFGLRQIQVRKKAWSLYFESTWIRCVFFFSFSFFFFRPGHEAREY